jgi:hypothetical protein
MAKKNGNGRGGKGKDLFLDLWEQFAKMSQTVTGIGQDVVRLNGNVARLNGNMRTAGRLILKMRDEQRSRFSAIEQRLYALEQD